MSRELVDMLAMLTDSFDRTTARLMRLEATVNVHVAVHAALIQAHPDPRALREHWLHLSSILLANASLHDGEKDALRRKAAVSVDTVRHITELVDQVAGIARDAEDAEDAEGVD